MITLMRMQPLYTQIAHSLEEKRRRKNLGIFLPPEFWFQTKESFAAEVLACAPINIICRGGKRESRGKVGGAGVVAVRCTHQQKFPLLLLLILGCHWSGEEMQSLNCEKYFWQSIRNTTIDRSRGERVVLSGAHLQTPPSPSASPIDPGCNWQIEDLRRSCVRN